MTYLCMYRLLMVFTMKLRAMSVFTNRTADSSVYL